MTKLTPWLTSTVLTRIMWLSGAVARPKIMKWALWVAAMGWTVTAIAQTLPAPTCNRGCMSEMADRLVNSMVRHVPGDVPLTDTFKATEDGIAAGLPMMTLWRTPTGSTYKYYAIDTASHQMFIAATLQEGGRDSLLFGRLKLEGRKFSELELYLTRSRAHAGFQFDANNLGKLPGAWNESVAPSRLMSREELTRVGKSMFDRSINLPPSGPKCVFLENAKVVGEEPEMMQYMLPPGQAVPSARNPDGSVPLGGCPLFPERPVDKNARVDVVDTEQGVVVAIATVYGLVQPYPVTKPTWSAFVPYDLMGSYLDTLKKIKASGKYHEPMLAATPASITVCQVFRVYDGKVQGFHMLERLGPPQAASPWIGGSSN